MLTAATAASAVTWPLCSFSTRAQPSKAPALRQEQTTAMAPKLNSAPQPSDPAAKYASTKPGKSAANSNRAPDCSPATAYSSIRYDERGIASTHRGVQPIQEVQCVSGTCTNGDWPYNRSTGRSGQKLVHQPLFPRKM